VVLLAEERLEVFEEPDDRPVVGVDPTQDVERVEGDHVVLLGFSRAGGMEQPPRLAPHVHGKLELGGEPDDEPSHALPLVGGDVQQPCAGVGEEIVGAREDRSGLRSNRYPARVFFWRPTP
jgi:hypothetical protein